MNDIFVLEHGLPLNWSSKFNILVRNIYVVHVIVDAIHEIVYAKRGILFQFLPLKIKLDLEASQPKIWHKVEKEYHIPT